VADRYFTPEEANELLPTVRPLVEEMVGHRRALAVATVRHARIATKIAGNGGGLLVKDLDEGLVDFPALRGDEEVLLCWRLGEEEVAFWHTPEDGFAGRKPLPIE
jgi:hypothetical protein